MSTDKYVLGLGLALGLQSCSKEPMDKVVDDLIDTCHAVEETNEPCGYRRGSLPEEYGGMCLNPSGMEMADRKLQEQTNCRLIVFAREHDGKPDYLILRKDCDLQSAHPGTEEEWDNYRVYPQ